MKKTKKFFSLVLAVLMCLSVVPMSIEVRAGDCDDRCINGVLYDGAYGETYATVCGLCDGYGRYDGVKYHNKLTGTITIAETATVSIWDNEKSQSYYDNRPVTRIKASAFAEDDIKKIILPESITSIGYKAFSGCKSLEEIDIPQNLVTIGDQAFSGCENLKGIYLPETLTYVGDYAFSETSSLKNVTVGMIDLTQLGTGALISDGIENITLTETVANIGNRGYMGDMFLSANIKNVIVDENNTYFASEDGVLFNKDKTAIICYPTGRTETEYSIPDSVEKICSNTFYNKNIEYVELPDKLKCIEEASFFLCSNLSNISTIPNSIEKIAENAFSLNTKLTDAYFDGTQYEWEKVEEVKDASFYPAVTMHFKEEIVDPVPPEEPEDPDEPDMPITPTEPEEPKPEDHEHDYDDDKDKTCNTCGYDRTENCDCRCHDDSFFAKIFWKITNFFNKLFKKNAICSCGVAHY